MFVFDGGIHNAILLIRAYNFRSTIDGYMRCYSQAGESACKLADLYAISITFAPKTFTKEYIDGWTYVHALLHHVQSPI